MNIQLQIISLVILLLLSAFFSGIETALISLRMSNVHSLVRQRRRGARSLLKLKQNPRKMLITILLGNNLVNIAAAAIATVLFTDLFGSKGVGVATGVMTFFILVFGEITPKTLAVRKARVISLFVAKPLEILGIILSPIIIILELIPIALTKIFDLKKEEVISESELKSIINIGVKEGVLQKDSAKMIHNVVKFEDVEIKDIMTEKKDVLMVDGNSTLKKVLAFVVKEPHSIYPIYLKNKNNIIGVLDIDDVVKNITNIHKKVRNFSKKVSFVPESTNMIALLKKIQHHKIQMAIVVDEKNKPVGLVTIEDIMEDIISPIPQIETTLKN